MRQAPPNQVRLSVPNLIRATGVSRPVASRDLREPDSSVSGRTAQTHEPGSACASPALGTRQAPPRPGSGVPTGETHDPGSKTEPGSPSRTRITQPNQDHPTEPGSSVGLL